MKLRANTAVDVLIGPFVDSTDGNTTEDGLTISQADVKLSKNGQALTQKTDATAAAFDDDGYYNCELDATDTDTEGNLVLIVHEAGALPVRHEYDILCEAAWDSLFVAKDTGFMDINVKAVSEDTAAADNLESACDNYSATRGLSGTALPAAAADAAGGLPISDAGGLDLDAQIGTDIDAILVDTSTTLPAEHAALPTAAEVVNEWETQSQADPTGFHVNVLEVNGTAQTANDNGADINAILTDTADMQPRVVAIEVDTGTTLPGEHAALPTAAENRTEMDSNSTELAKIGTIPALDGGSQTIGAAIAKLADDNGGADFDAGTDSLQEIRDRGDAAWITGAGGSDRLLLVDTTIATLATQTSFTLTAGSADDDAYNNCTIVVEDVSTATQKSIGMVLGYTGATKTVTLKEALAFTIAPTDKVYILAENSLKSTVANRQLDVTATGAAGIDWANVENPTTALDLSATDIQLVDTTTTSTDMRGTDNAATAAGLSTHDGKLDTVDGIVDAILVDTGTTLPGEHAALPTAAENRAEMDSNSTQLAAIVADTNELQADWTNDGRLDLIIDAVLADTNALQLLFLSAFSEVTSKPAAGASMADKLAYIFHAAVNKAEFNKTTGVQKVYQSNGSSTLGTRDALTDDGTTVTTPAVS